MNCINQIDKLSIIIQCDTQQLQFEALDQKFISTKFNIIFNFEDDSDFNCFWDFYKQYSQVFQVQRCQINLNHIKVKLEEYPGQIDQLFTFIWEELQQNITRYILFSRQRYEFENTDILHQYINLLYQTKANIGDNFRILNFDFIFAFDQEYSLSNPLPIENLKISYNICNYSCISMQLLSNYQCIERLKFSIDKNIQVKQSEIQNQCPQQLVIKIIYSYIAWEKMTIDILKCFHQKENLQEFIIQLPLDGFYINNISNLLTIYKFIKNCPLLKKLIIPYSNDPQILVKLTKLVQNSLSIIKYLQLRYSPSLTYGGNDQTQNILFNLFANICKNKHELRQLLIELPSRRISEYRQQYKNLLEQRTLPLDIKIKFPESSNENEIVNTKVTNFNSLR
ncbi:hypothetical protein FGO68_gene9361 [Halteria grandinella]|uniref:Uncharacterized protein n=1 Tax=Halteria grandinella TaxID=5974 RepID=A0A8J8T3Y7_HALGN|nr:hypothetical protein FGO68_gene9361 [Halteria grandinella]